MDGEAVWLADEVLRLPKDRSGGGGEVPISLRICLKICVRYRTQSLVWV
jgi:hypothetical protein